LTAAFVDNPLGQGRQQTPLAVVFTGFPVSVWDHQDSQPMPGNPAYSGDLALLDATGDDDRHAAGGPGPGRA